MARKRKQQKLYIPVLILIICAAFFIYRTYFFQQQYLEVTFVDVGQGDCAYISTPLGQKVLLDGGENSYNVNQFLNGKGTVKLDKAIVSHYHDDHGKGVAEIMQTMPTESLYMPDVEYRPALHDRLVSEANAQDTDIYYISQGQNIFVDDDTEFVTLFPDIEKYTPKKEDANNDSLVLKLVYGDTSFLFTGDIEKVAERAILGDENLKSDVLKAAHHGSNTSSIQEFIDNMSPSYAIISVGRNNRYNHPHADVIKRLIDAMIKTYRTDENGSITFIVDKESILTIKTSK